MIGEWVDLGWYSLIVCAKWDIEMRRRAGEVGFGMVEVEERGRRERGEDDLLDRARSIGTGDAFCWTRDAAGVKGAKQTEGDSGKGWASTVCEWSGNPQSEILATQPSLP